MTIQPPPGFVLDKPKTRSSAPPPPAGFVLDGARAPVDNAPEAPVEGRGFIGSAGNVARGIGERAVALGGGLAEAIGNVVEPAGDFMQRNVGDIVREEDGSLTWRKLTPEESAQPSAPLTLGRAAAKASENVDFGYEEMTSWDDFKESPVRNFIPFALEQGLISTPDMMAAIGALPAYVMARTGELGRDRSQNNAMENATVEDLIKVLPASVGSAMLERIGARGMFGLDEAAVQSLKQVPKAAGKAALKEGITEAAQESMEYGATTIGTEAGFDPAQMAENAAAGAVAGSGFGGVTRGATATGEAITGRGVQAEANLPLEGRDPADDEIPGATVEAGGPPADAPVTPGAAGGAVSPPAMSAAPVNPEDRAILRRAQMTDDDIDLMAPEEIAAEVEAARASGVRVNQRMVEDAAQYLTPEQIAPDPAQPAQQNPQMQRIRDEFNSPEAQARRADNRAMNIAGQVRPPIDAVPETPGQAARRMLEGYKARGEDARGTRQKPANVDAGEDLDLAGLIVNPEPTEAQKEAGNYQKYHAKVNGFDIAIETPKGGIRSGKSRNGTPWQVKMPAHYGYIKRTQGADGDQIDVYFAPNSDSKRVYVVDQRQGPGSSQFDEHKAIMGATSVSEARSIYQQGFSDGTGAERIGAITPMSMSEFRKWVNEGDTSKPLRMGKPIPTNEQGFPIDKQGRVKKPESLIEFLARQGGIQDQGGDLESIGLTDRKSGFVSGAGPLIRKNGMTLDAAREMALEAGYLTDPGAGDVMPSDSTITDLLDALDQDSRNGRQVFSQYDADHAFAWTQEQGSEAAEDAQSEYDAIADEVSSLTGLSKDDPFVDDVARAMLDQGLSIDDAIHTVVMTSNEEAGTDVQAAIGDIPFFEDTPDAVQPGTVLETSAAGGEAGQRGEGRRPESQAQGSRPSLPDRRESRPQAGSEVNDGRRDQPGAGEDQAEVSPADVFDQAFDEGLEESFGAPAATARNDIGDPTTVRIGSRTFPFTSYAEVSRAYRETVDATDATVSGRTGPQAPEAQILDGSGNPIAYISYNGKVWPGTEWKSGIKPLYDPRDEQLAVEAGADNKPQTVIPGAERISDRQQAERRGEGKKRASKPQREPGGMFDDAETAPQLFDQPAKPGATEKPGASSPRKGEVGMMLSAGEKVLTTTGRETSPFPKIGMDTERKTRATLKRVDTWLMQNALDEARSRGDDFNARQFEQNLSNPSQSDKDSAEYYLFDADFVQAVPRPVTRPLVDPDDQPEPSMPAGYELTLIRRASGDEARQSGYPVTGQAHKAVVVRKSPYAVYDAIRPTRAQAIADALGQAQRNAPKSSTDLAKSAAKNTLMGLDDVASGLTALFGGKDKLSSGLTFDEDTYRKAVPFFKAGVAHFKEAGRDISEMVKQLVRHLAQSGMDREAVQNMRPYVRRFVEDVQSGEIALDDTAEAPQKPQNSPETSARPAPKASPSNDVVALVRDRLIDPEGGFATINQARKFLMDNGWTPKNEAVANKEAEELIERAVVMAAMDIVKGGKKRGPVITYDRLVNLYKRQPRLATRTSTSMAEQAYSTPAPLAYVASRLADIEGGSAVYEPTAGNGMLLIETNPNEQQVYANELNPDRAKAVTEHGYRVTRQDATEMETPEGVDRLIANPPFGAVRSGGESKVFTVGEHRTTAIDQAIMLKTLEGLGENGRAVFIIGSVKGDTEAARSDNYNSSQKRKFFKRLYDNYRVSEHFTVDGALYQKQGAAWPVDVIVVDGRGKSALKLPAAQVPPLLKSWDDLKGYLDGERTNADSGRPEVSGTAATEPRPNAGNTGSVSAPGVSRPDGKRPGARPEPGPSGFPDDRSEPAASGPTDLFGVGSGGNAGGTGNSTPAVAAPRAPREKASANAAGQVPYRPYSRKGTPLNTLAPAGLGASMDQSLARIEQQHGDIDAFVARSLGYSLDELPDVFSAEQVDAIALAIDNVAKGEAFIIGDQTGIGKGRVVAAAIRFAHKQGMVPVFVTEKPDLYGDMYRDLSDIQWEKSLKREPEIFMTNSNLSVPLDDDAVEWAAERDAARDAGKTPPPRRGRFSVAKSVAETEKTMGEILRGVTKPDVIFTTYDQMNSRGEETSRRRFMQQMTSRAFLIMDESHNAGGQGQDAMARRKKGAPPPRSEKFREWVGEAKAVMYSSATYAKSPQVMDLYSRTGMSKAVDDIKKLPEIIAKGGVPLQQVVSSMLARAGQYARRERSFEGVEYGLDVAPVDQTAYGDFAKAIQAIYSFDRQVSEFRGKWIEEWLKENGAGLAMDNAIGDLGASSTEFSSIMHNIVNQMLLAIKADAAAERALTALKNDEKPVVALSFTNESFITDFAAENDIQTGGEIGINFKDVVRRYLERALRITIKRDDDSKEYIYIPITDLDSSDFAAYEAALEAIETADIESLPVSPIDHIRHRLAKEGYSVREVTGRGTMINYAKKTPILINRPSSETGASGKRVTIKKFNDGSLDAVILNKSGSTGVSLHASDKYKDQRRRRMILVQADPNIDTHMQMLGRVHRTGQVIPPAYTQLTADIPAEARPTAVLMKKMASLNANTTAARKSTFTADAVDFMNEYGDMAAVQWAKDNPLTHAMLGAPIKMDDKGKVTIENPIQKLTGRLMLLEPKEQQDLLDTLTDSYNSILEQKEAMGENALEAKAFDFEAQPVSRRVIRPSTGSSPFEGEAVIEKMNVKTVGRAMPPSEVVQAAADAVKGVDVRGESFARALAMVEKKGSDRARSEIERMQAEHDRYVKWVVGGLKSADAKQNQRQKAEDNWQTWREKMSAMPIGKRVVLKGAGEDPRSVEAIVIGVEQIGKAQNPTAQSDWRAAFAVPDMARQLHMPFSQITMPRNADQAASGVIIEQPGWGSPIENLEKAFDAASREGREDRFIATGNILAAYDQMDKAGQIIQFTMENGDVQPGVLLPREFDLTKWEQSRRFRFSETSQAMRFLKESEDKTVEDDKGFINVENTYRGYVFTLNSARGKGGVFFTDDTVRKIYDDWTKVGRDMVATVDERTASQLITAMRGLGAQFVATGDPELAEEIVYEKSRRQYSLAPDGWGVADTETPALKLSQAEQDRIRDIVRQVAGLDDVSFPDRITVPASARGLEAWGRSNGEPSTASGLYSPTKDFIAIAMDTGGTGTAYHEAFHRVQNLFLTDQEKAVLERESDRLRSMLDEAYQEAGFRDRMQAGRMSQKEVEAEAFRLYAEAFEQGGPGMRLHVGIRRAWNRILNALRRVRNALRGMGYQTADDVFERALRGDMAERGQSQADASPDVEFSVAPDPKTEAFKRWFGDSKVVDDQGRPLVVYHGTNSDFEAFDATRAGTKKYSDWGPGIYFTPSASTADYYRGEAAKTDDPASNRLFDELEAIEAAAPFKNGARTLGDDYFAKLKEFRKARAAAENASGQIVPAYVSIQNPYIQEYTSTANPGVGEEARSRGHDGVIVLNGRGEIDEVVAFSPSQIKSVYNRGTFDPDDDRIMYSLVGNERVPAHTKPRNAPAALVGQRMVGTIKRISGNQNDRSGREDGESAGDYIHRKWVDYLHPVLMMQKKESGGASLTDLNDAYLNARLAEDSALAEIQALHDTYLTPALDGLIESGATLEDLHNLLYAMHAEERNRVVGLRNPEDTDLYRAVTDPSVKGASGWSTNEARQVIAELSQDREKYRALRRAAKGMQDMLKANLAGQRRAGLISADTYDLLTAQFQNYVPLKGMDGMDEQGNWNPSKGKGFDVRGDEFKTSVGRYSEADNVVAHAVTQAETSVLRQKKNEVGKAMLRFVNEFDPKGENFAQVYWTGDEQIGDITKAPDVYKRAIGSDGTVTKQKVRNPFSNMDDVIAVKVGGRAYYVRFKDPKVGLALRKMNDAQLGAMSKMARTITGWQSFVNTRANPAFIPINIIRDAQTGAVHLLDEGFSAKDVAGITANIPKAWGALWRKSRGKPGDGEWDRTLAEYIKAGGKIDFDARVMGFDQQLDEIRKQVARAAGDENKVAAAWRALTKFFSDLNDAGENGMRLVAFKAAREKQGRTAKEAAFLARDLTVDFKKHGELGPMMNAWYVFFNAALQGNYNIAKRMAKSKLVRGVLASAMFGGMLQHMWNSMMAGDDEDGESYYDKLVRNEGYRLERQMLFFIPGTERYISFPLPYGYNAFWHLGVQGGAAMSGTTTPGAAVLNSARVAFDAFNPIGSGSLASMGSPTVLDPFLDILINENFFGGEIYPKANPFDTSPAPDSQRAWRSTNPVFKDGAEWLNWISGGNEIEPGYADIHPDTLEHLWEFFAGGIGRFGSQTLETGIRAADGEFEPKKTPWVRSFYGQMDQDSQRTEYFRQREAVQLAEGRMKDYVARGDEQEIQNFQKRHRIELEAAAAYKAAEKQRRQINKQRREIEGAQGMTSTERQQLLDDLEASEMEIMKAARAAFAEARANQSR